MARAAAYRNTSIDPSIASDGSLYHSASDAFAQPTALPPHTLYARSVPAPECTSVHVSPQPPAAVCPSSPSISARSIGPNVDESTDMNIVGDVPRSATTNRRTSIALPASMFTVSPYPAR